MPWPLKIFKFGRGSNRVGPVPRYFWPPPMSQWRHLKRGSKYNVVGKVRLNYATRIPQDCEMLVLYVNEEGESSARARDEFMDGRFERVD